MTTITRRAVLFGIGTACLGLTACISAPPMDEKEVNDAVSQVDGVTSADIKVETNGGTSGWWLDGEIGLPDDPAQARTVYENCLRAIAGVPAESNLGIYVYGRSSSGTLDPKDVGAPDGMYRLKEHFS